MVNNNVPRQRIIFPEEARLAISGILKKYKLEQTREEIWEGKGKIPREAVIIKATRNFISNKLPGKDLISILQKDLDIPRETAEKITQDIKTKLVSLTQKVTIEEDMSPEIKETALESLIIPSPLDVVSALSKEAPITKKSPVEEPLTLDEEPAVKIREIKKIPKKSDSYREPIE